jgi:putative membrane-bound dehydrogenase-like protein
MHTTLSTERRAPARRDARNATDAPSGSSALRLAAHLILLPAFLCLGPASAPAADTKPLPPAEALASIVVEPGLRLELVAAEPLTADPVAVAWDERGRLFVAENRGYPTGPGSNQPPAGVIALLEDTDRDGRMDKRTEFATGLHYPNGLMPWRGGFFVTDAPDIWFLKDTDGDGRADVRKVVLTGFMTNSTTQLRVSHPTLGLDGWVYLTAGLTGGKITSPEHPDRPAVEFKKSDSRFHPDTFEIEPEPGQGQFGLCFDDFGRRFIVSNRNPLQHVVLHPRYLKRNPHLAFSDTVQDVSPHGDDAKVWPLSEDHTTAAFHPKLMSTPHAGTFTSACGISIYRGSALPPAMYGNAFVCEPAQNLVQRQVIEPDGPTFKSRPATPGRESIATRDTWFRPVFTANGPDGALYLCDLYRKILDHPQYLPEHIRDTLDYEAGKGMGRIYRLVGGNLKSGISNLKSDMGKASNRKLIDSLKADDAWTRDTAFRLLLERKDKKVVPHLKAAIARTSSTKPVARVLALSLLDANSSLDERALTAALDDPDPRVHEKGIWLLEPRLDGKPETLKAAASAGVSNDSRLRYAAALVAGGLEGTYSRAILQAVAAFDSDNRWSRAAVLTASVSQLDQVFEAILRAGHNSSRTEMFSEFGQLFSAALPKDRLQSLLGKGLAVRGLDAELWQMTFVTGVANGARSRGLAKGGKSALMNLVTGDTPEAKQAALRVTELMQRAREMAVNADLPAAERVAAIELLGHGDFAQAGEALQGLLNLQTPTEVQVAAVRALAQMPEDSVAQTFVAKWRAYTPPVRDAVLGVLLSQARFLPALLTAIENGVVQPWAIPANRRTQLLKNRSEDIRQRAEKAFADLEGGDRMKVYEEYKSVLAMKGNGPNGRAVFTRACAQCHRYGTEGAQVGPDLSGIRHQPADAILLHIIAPNAEIYPGFAAYEAETKDGRVITGLLVSETATSVTLRAAQGIEETILRANLASFSSTSLSLMPQDLEKTMTKQELADLMAFLKGE